MQPVLSPAAICASQAVAAGCTRSEEVAAVAAGRAPQLWLPDRGAMGRAGVDQWACVPSGVQSVLLQGFGTAPGLVVAMSERPR